MSDEQKEQQKIEQSAERAERTFTSKTLILLSVLLVVLIAAIYGVATLLLRFSENQHTAAGPPVSNPTALPNLPNPQLQVQPKDDLEKYTAEEQALLQSYGWVDKNSGIARIPIDESMKIISETGLPVSQTPTVGATSRVEAADSGFPHPTLAPQATPGVQPTMNPQPSATVSLQAPTQTSIPEGQGDPQAGRQAFLDIGCSGCHEDPNADIAPNLHGVYGSEVKLESGETILADEAYIRESIQDPKAKVVSGYRAIMPDFQNFITPQQLLDLIAYIKSIGANP